MPEISTKVIRAARWSLMVLCATALSYAAYLGVAGLATQIRRDDWSLEGVFGVLFVFAISLFMVALPAIMLHSLITKRLYGFACVIGFVITLTVFYAALVLPRQLGIFNAIEFLASSKSPAQPLGVFLGLAVSLGLLALPFWLLFRLPRLTTQWAYPKFFKPLESRL